jgi:peptidoglycan/xylan/chitin deacetylase (PgdA/CDA1 family)
MSNRFRSKALILLYHRAADAEIDPQLLSVSPHNLSRHLEHLSTHYKVISLEDLADARLHRDEIPDRTVAVTFDDGYADNLAVAKPLLDRFQIPSTVFVAGGTRAQDQEFWWDELERIFLYPSRLPSVLQLDIGAISYRRDLSASVRYTHDEFARHRTWSVLHRELPTSRHGAYRDLCVMLRRESPMQRTTAMNAIRSWSGLGTTGQPIHRRLRPDEIKELGSGGFVQVGAHAVSHAALSALTPGEQLAEICDSRDRLTSILGEPPTSFAYPFGSKTDYTADTVDAVRSAGFKLACSNFPDVVTGSVDRYQLPRMVVRNWNQETFAQMVERWLQGRG